MAGTGDWQETLDELARRVHLHTDHPHVSPAGFWQNRPGEGLPVHVFQAVRTEVPLDPVLRLFVAERADVPSPENVPAIAIGERNRVDLHEEALQPISIDIRVFLVIGPQRDLDEGVIPYVAGGVEERLPQRIRSVLSGKHTAREKHENGYRA